MNGHSVSKTDILLLERIFKRIFRGNYPIPKSEITLNRVFICAELDLEYRFLSYEVPQGGKQNLWYFKDSNGIISVWNFEDYFHVLYNCLKGENSSSLQHYVSGVKRLNNKFNNTLSVIKRIHSCVNIETGLFLYDINQYSNKKLFVKCLYPKGKGKNKGFGSYVYTFPYELGGYIDSYIAQNQEYNRHRNPTEVSLKSSSSVFEGKSEIEEMKAKLAIHISEICSRFSNELSCYELTKYIDENLFVILSDFGNTVARTQFEKNLSTKMDEISLILSKQNDNWRENCNIKFKNLIADYKGHVSTELYSDLLISYAKFVGDYFQIPYFIYGTTYFEWLNYVDGLYEKAIFNLKGTSNVIKEGVFTFLRAVFLFDNRHFIEAGKYLADSYNILSNSSTISLNYQKSFADVIYSQALYFEEINSLNTALDYYNKALDLRRSIAKRDSKRIVDVAKTLNNTGNLYKSLFNYDAAFILLKESTDILSSLNSLNYKDEDIKLYRIIAKRNLGILLRLKTDCDASQCGLSKLLDIVRNLVKKDPDKYFCDLAFLLLDVAEANRCFKLNAEIEKNYFEALDIFRMLTKRNASKYSSRLAWTLNMYVLFYKEKSYVTNAITSFEESLTIYNKLEKGQNGTYASSIARTYALLADSNWRIKDYCKATDYIDKSLSLYKALFNSNPRKYLFNLLWSLYFKTLIKADLKGEAVSINSLKSIRDQCLTAYYEKEYSQEFPPELRLICDKLESAVRDTTFELHRDLLIELYIKDILRRTRRHLL